MPIRKYKSKKALLDGENLKTYILEPALSVELREAKNQEPEAIEIPEKAKGITRQTVCALPAFSRRQMKIARRNFSRSAGLSASILRFIASATVLA